MLVEAKSNLARLMATENLVVEERNVQTAYFDMKSRVLVVPILNGNLSNHLYDLLLGHEVGHALETPAAGWHDSVIDLKVNKDILNVCEDARIEKKIKRKFPGLKLSFIRGYHELMDMDFFGVKDVNLNTLNFIDRVNLYTKGGASQGINFSPEETVLLEEVETTETWEEVVTVAKKIQEFMKEQLKEIPKIQTKVKVVQPSQDGDESGEEMDGEQVEMEADFGSADGKKAKVGKNIDAGEEAGQAASGSTEGEGGSQDGSSGGSGGSKEADIESKTDKAFREKEKLLHNTVGKRDSIYNEIPKLKLENVIIPHTEILKVFNTHNKNEKLGIYSPADLKKEFIKFKNESNKIVSYLVKEFELRKNADQQSRAKVSKTGELNMNKIHEYRITDDIFERMTKVPNGKSHGLVMFIDWSGSMHEHLNATIKQLLNLVMFCKKVNIPFDVYAFTTQWEKKHFVEIQKAKVGDIVVDNVALMNILSSRMTTKEYVDMASILLDFGTGYRRLTTHCSVPDSMTLGGTPLNSTIIAAFDIIPEFKEKNKLQIVNAIFLTDGESNMLHNRYSYIDPKTNNHRTDREVTASHNRRSFLRDPKTKAVVEVKSGRGYGGDSSEQTKALLSLLKEHAQCNLIGFFIADTRSIRSAMEMYGEHSDDYHKRKEAVDKSMIQFRKEKTFVLEKSGYDEYYLIRSNTLDTDDEELTVNSNTTRGLVSAFSKYTEGKISSRIILNRFIKLIA